MKFLIENMGSIKQQGISMPPKHDQENIAMRMCFKLLGLQSLLQREKRENQRVKSRQALKLKAKQMTQRQDSLKPR